jgi:hypothetical protein
MRLARVVAVRSSLPTVSSRCLAAKPSATKAPEDPFANVPKDEAKLKEAIQRLSVSSRFLSPSLVLSSSSHLLCSAIDLCFQRWPRYGSSLASPPPPPPLLFFELSFFRVANALARTLYIATEVANENSKGKNHHEVLFVFFSSLFCCSEFLSVAKRLCFPI